MPRKPRQGRAVPSEPRLTSPLSTSTSTTTSCVVIPPQEVCLLTDNNHASSTSSSTSSREHALLLADYLRRDWKVHDGNLLVEEYGGQVVTEACRELVSLQDRKMDGRIRSRSGFAVRLIQRVHRLREETPQEEQPAWTPRVVEGGQR